MPIGFRFPAYASGWRFLPSYILLACLLLAALPNALGQEASLQTRLARLWNQETIPQQAFAGLVVVDPATGKTIFSHNGSRTFTPASNTKLFSTALALTRLGPEYRMETEVRAEAPWDPESGVLQGDLALVGGGDPSISSRTFPYDRETAQERDYDLPALKELAKAVADRGIRVIEGDIIGDDRAYVWEPLREGWAQDDALFDYGAPVSALTLNDNTVRLSVFAGMRDGEPTRLDLLPTTYYYDILNEVHTVRGAKPQLEWDRIWGQRTLLLEGALPPASAPIIRHIAIDDPALFAAQAFREALLAIGITVKGNARSRHLLAPNYSHAGPELRQKRGASAVSVPEANKGQIHLRLSPPLSDLIRMVNKQSQNLHAELLLCEVSRAKNGFGSRNDGLKELRAFLTELGISAEQATFSDASGMSRLNLVSPESTARLLTAMWKSPHRDVWMDSLPIGGKDGTLSSRFDGNVLAERVNAKTGTLTGVSALSGYARTRSGKVLVFSAMVNNHNGPGSASRKFLDALALEIAQTP